MNSFFKFLILVLIIGGAFAFYIFKRPRIESFSAKSPVTSGATSQITAVFRNGSGSIDPGIGVVESGASKTTGVIKEASTFTLTVTSWMGKAQASTTINVAPAPKQPRIVGLAEYPSKQSGCTASVDEQSGCSYKWEAVGATITGGGDAREVSFETGESGSLELRCWVINLAGTQSTPGTFKALIAPRKLLPSSDITISVEQEGNGTISGGADLLFDGDRKSMITYSGGHGGDGEVQGRLFVTASWKTPMIIAKIESFLDQQTYGGNYKHSVRQFQLQGLRGGTWVTLKQQRSDDALGSNMWQGEQVSLNHNIPEAGLTAVRIVLFGSAYSYEGDRQQFVKLSVAELQLFK